MAYNAGYPMGFTPGYYPTYGQTQAPTQTQNTSIIWVQGEAGAKSYLVAPNTTVQLWDTEEQTIYLKSADASGMPSMKVLDYKVRDASPQSGAHAVMPGAEKEYVTKDELQALEERIKRQFEKITKKGESGDE